MEHEKFVEALSSLAKTAAILQDKKFKRDDGITPEPAPATLEEWKALKDHDYKTLLRMGCRPWDDLPEGYTLWLFPVEWYDSIPERMPVFTINNNTEIFKKGETPSGQRYGCLSYGIVCKTEQRKGKLTVVVLDPASPTFKEDLQKAIETATTNGQQIENVGIAQVDGEIVTLQHFLSTIDGDLDDVKADIIAAVKKSEEDNKNGA